MDKANVSDFVRDTIGNRLDYAERVICALIMAVASTRAALESENFDIRDLIDSDDFGLITRLYFSAVVYVDKANEADGQAK